MPKFFATATDGWVRCDSVKDLSAREVACAIPRIGGRNRLVISSRDYFDPGRGRLLGQVIGEVEAGRLVDFPSGDRVAVPSEAIE